MDNVYSIIYNRIVLQQESEKNTHQRVFISNLKMSLNEALTQNTEYREKFNRIRGIVNAENEPRDGEYEPESESHTLSIIQVS